MSKTSSFPTPRSVWPRPPQRVRPAPHWSEMGILARRAVTPMTAGLPSATDAPLQRSEVARSAITRRFGTGYTRAALAAQPWPHRFP